MNIYNLIEPVYVAADKNNDVLIDYLTTKLNYTCDAEDRQYSIPTREYLILTPDKQILFTKDGTLMESYFRQMVFSFRGKEISGYGIRRNKQGVPRVWIKITNDTYDDSLGIMKKFGYGIVYMDAKIDKRYENEGYLYFDGNRNIRMTQSWFMEEKVYTFLAKYIKDAKEEVVKLKKESEEAPAYDLRLFTVEEVKVIKEYWRFIDKREEPSAILNKVIANKPMMDYCMDKLREVFPKVIVDAMDSRQIRILFHMALRGTENYTFLMYSTDKYTSLK